ncbi:uncharacterized protein LOC128231470 [Mya arenaria]|uniref:uncharacterized protein LOC128231470 n=1 Tax=Mya arenaria TaxID=6604 RepID=UPI0022DF8A62|nr:uncharacterized protein LOC128231470 [Mya arenaria]XP_052800313.1 uncharacterized protein LOC128231470 [Mya arenaria]XP_052800322.1 uncharacterized protein LOC128231470 [Mya arenaria]XP_052800330.1 uncharacterized protein LOC128231470 [Mya arenaria]
MKKFHAVTMAETNGSETEGNDEAQYMETSDMVVGLKDQKKSAAVELKDVKGKNRISKLLQEHGNFPDLDVLNVKTNVPDAFNSSPIGSFESPGEEKFHSLKRKRNNSESDENSLQVSVVNADKFSCAVDQFTEQDIEDYGRQQKTGVLLPCPSFVEGKVQYGPRRDATKLLEHQDKTKKATGVLTSRTLVPVAGRYDENYQFTLMVGQFQSMNINTYQDNTTKTKFQCEKIPKQRVHPEAVFKFPFRSKYLPELLGIIIRPDQPVNVLFTFSGVSLDKFQQGPFQVKDIICFLKQAMKAVYCLHQEDFVHTRIQPHCFLVDRDNEGLLVVKLTDCYNLERNEHGMDSIVKHLLTDSRLKAQYYPPELCRFLRNWEKCGVTAFGDDMTVFGFSFDTYGIALTTLYMLKGEHVLQNEQPWDVILKVAVTPHLVQNIEHHLSNTNLGHILFRMLEPDAQKRMKMTKALEELDENDNDLLKLNAKVRIFKKVKKKMTVSNKKQLRQGNTQPLQVGTNYPVKHIANSQSETTGIFARFSHKRSRTNDKVPGLANISGGANDTFAGYAHSNDGANDTFAGYAHSHDGANDTFAGYAHGHDGANDTFAGYAHSHDGGNDKVASLANPEDGTNKTVGGEHLIVTPSGLSDEASLMLDDIMDIISPDLDDEYRMEHLKGPTVSDSQDILEKMDFSHFPLPEKAMPDCSHLGCKQMDLPTDCQFAKQTDLQITTISNTSDASENMTRLNQTTALEEKDADTDILQISISQTIGNLEENVKQSLALEACMSNDGASIWLSEDDNTGQIHDETNTFDGGDGGGGGGDDVGGHDTAESDEVEDDNDNGETFKTM